MGWICGELSFLDDRDGAEVGTVESRRCLEDRF